MMDSYRKQNKKIYKNWVKHHNLKEEEMKKNCEKIMKKKEKGSGEEE
jgi:hypothetical protein